MWRTGHSPWTCRSYGRRSRRYGEELVPGNGVSNGVTDGVRSGTCTGRPAECVKYSLRSGEPAIFDSATGVTPGPGMAESPPAPVRSARQSPGPGRTETATTRSGPGRPRTQRKPAATTQPFPPGSFLLLLSARLLHMRPQFTGQPSRTVLVQVPDGPDAHSRVRGPRAGPPAPGLPPMGLPYLLPSFRRILRIPTRNPASSMTTMATTATGGSPAAMVAVRGPTRGEPQTAETMMQRIIAIISPASAGGTVTRRPTAIPSFRNAVAMRAGDVPVLLSRTPDLAGPVLAGIFITHSSACAEGFSSLLRCSGDSLCPDAGFSCPATGLTTV